MDRKHWRRIFIWQANVEACVAPGGYEVLAQVYAMDGRTLMGRMLFQ